MSYLRELGFALVNRVGDQPANRERNCYCQPRLATGDFATLLHAVCAGIGIALLPWAICETELLGGDLIQVLPGWGVADGIIHLVYTSRRGMLPGVRAVIDFAAQALDTAAT